MGMLERELGEKRSLTRKPRRAMKESVPPRQMGSMAMSKGPYLEPISVVVIRDKNNRSSTPHNEGFSNRQTGTRPLKMGHGPLVVMYPVSL